MRNAKSQFKRYLSMLLAVVMIFSLFSGIIVVEAATISTVLYQRITENTVDGPKFRDVLIIRGMNLDLPEVYIGEFSDILIPINTSLSSKSEIIIDDQDKLKNMAGKVHNIQVYSAGVAVGAAINYDLTDIPTVTSISKSKVYIGDPFSIEGLFEDKLDTATDKLYVAGTLYKFAAPVEASVDANDENKINVVAAKAPNTTGIGDVVIERIVGGGGKYKIESVLKNSVTVVGRLTGIDIERVDPNTGPRNIKNKVNIYGKNGFSNFNDNMRIFVNGSEGSNKGTIIDGDGKVIGLSVELPTSATSGTANIILTNSIGNSEYEIVNGFIYQDIGNTLTIDTDGISPNFQKETEDVAVTISGRNIGYFDGTNYDKLTGVTKAASPLIKYAAYGTYFPDTTTYKVKYTGLYNNLPVTIIRQISVFVDGDAKIKTDALTPDPTFDKSKDIIIVDPKDVNLDPNQPKYVDVKIKTTTTVFAEPAGTIYYARNEEYTVKNGFRYIPDEIAPEIISLTPEFGPSDEEIYMTIKGKDFQVFPDGTTPIVIIGDREIKGKVAGVNLVRVYDDQNREVDGKIITLGTKIKIKLPAGAANMSGAVDLTVINPSKGQFTKVNAFEYRDPNRTSDKMPKIISLKEPYADMRGGTISGENVLITGENIDTSLVGNDRVIITIDGEKAALVGKVSADGKTVTIIPPPGTLPGKTMLQIINEDGSMAEMEFEYKRIITAPKITRIVPTKGGNGTKLVIKGVDFLLPDDGVMPDDPKRKGTVVLLNGKELNAYNYLPPPAGTITDINDSIYYNDDYDPDGAGPLAAYPLHGKMVTVVDSTTIYVDIPDKFYSYSAAAGAASDYLKSEEIFQGNLTVQVLNPDGAKSKENILFEYLKPGTKPRIISIDPITGSIAGGTVVTITGEDFQKSALGDIKVYFGSELATKVEYINTNKLVVQAPAYPYALPQGKDYIDVPVMVMNYDGAMAVYYNPNNAQNPGFKYRIPGSKPIVTKLDPAKGSAAGGELIKIYGEDFRIKDGNTEPTKVYFNGVEADVDWNSNKLLIATAPPSKKEGPVDVVVVNHDAGTYTFKSYTYEVSKPKITTVTPNVMAKIGGTKLQINGTDFKKSDLSELLDNEYIDRHINYDKPAHEQIDNLIMFGDVSTGDKKTIDTIIGPYYTELNELRVDYDKDTSLVTLSRINGDNPIYIKSLVIPEDSAHLFIVNGTEDLGDARLGDEGVLVEVTPSQVIVTRRIAAYAKWENNGSQMSTIAPAVGSINNRNLYVKNLDGGMATSVINVMNPASEPTITYISPRNKVKREGGIIEDYRQETSTDLEYYTYTPLDGGAFITINGTDFRRNVKVYMGDKLLEVVSKSANDNQLVVKVPKGTAADLNRLYRIIVVNEDGATADSSTINKPHYIVYKVPESNPVIESVSPANTSSKGQNHITIFGKDFREDIKVFIGGVESTSVTRLLNTQTGEYDRLRVRVPLGLLPGKTLIQVMNTDFGFGEKKDAITIISSPDIDEVYDIAKDREIDPVLFSIDGGQNIRLEGNDFMTGVKVILGGILKEKADLKPGETGITCYNLQDAEMVIVGGVVAPNIKVLNGNALTFTTPKLAVGDVSIIVVNADGGVSNEINASYQKPYPDAPTGIDVEVVDSDTVKLEWDKIPGTSHYEIFASYSSNGNSGSEYVYVGSVKAYEISEGRLRYYVDGLKASSWYSFRLKSVNAYGPSGFSMTTHYVRTKDTKITTYYHIAEDYKAGIAQKDKVDILGSSLTFTAGEASIGNYSKGLVVYFNQTSYINYNPKSVDIGLELLRKYPNNSILINENDFSLKLISKNLLVKETTAVNFAKLSDSKMTILVNKDLKAKGDEIRLRLPKGYKAITAPVAINTIMQVEQSKTTIKALNGSMEISFNINDSLKKLYPGGFYIAYYNNLTGKLEILSSKDVGKTKTAQINKPGEYMLIGKFTK